MTNCSEAVLAAACVHGLDRRPGRFDTLRGMTVFLLGAVLMAPFLSSFPDAWIVSWQRGEQFWMVWRNRFFANTLTELVCVPAIVMLLEGGAGALRRARLARIGEAILFAWTTINLPLKSDIMVARKFYDLSKAGKSLTPGGSYLAKLGTKRYTFQVDASATSSPTPIIGRLLRLE